MQQNFKNEAENAQETSVISEKWELCKWIYGHKKQAWVKYFALFANEIMQSQADHNTEHCSNLF